jgi:hypothetical protein
VPTTAGNAKSFKHNFVKNLPFRRTHRAASRCRVEMFFLLALSLVSSAFAQQAGGYTPATAEEIAPGSHCHVLASYAFEQLKAQSNSLDLNHKSCVHPPPPSTAAAARAREESAPTHLPFSRLVPSR